MKADASFLGLSYVLNTCLLYMTVPLTNPNISNLLVTRLN